MSRPIDADAIPYTMLYKEDWLKGTGVEKPGVWKDTIDAMPTIEPERKKGKWILHPEIKNVYGGTVVQCSECGEEYVVHYLEDEKYCRSCGAKMEEQNETD